MRNKRLLCGWLALCMVMGLCSFASAGVPVGSSRSELTPSTTKTYIRLSKAVAFFTGDTYGEGTKHLGSEGDVYQLVTTDYYVPSDGNEYYGLYVDSQLYSALRSDVYEDILSQEALLAYIQSEVWGASDFVSLKLDMNLRGDVRVHGLQLALTQLGYYYGALDGSYGEDTAAAVKAFQADNGLTADGSAGVLTQPVIYAKVLGSSQAAVANTSSETGSDSADAVANETETNEDNASASGTLTTNSSVNLRKSASKSSTLLAVIPANTTLSYSGSITNSGVTWYLVKYGTKSGFVMGTYVTVQGSGESTSTSGTLRTVASVNLRKAATTSSARLAVVPASTDLSFTDFTNVNGIIWYYVKYGSLYGYLMGTYVKVTGSGSGDTELGSVEITKASTRIRKTPNGAKTGYVLSLGSVVPYYQVTSLVGGYIWYKIKTSSGLVGYVRGDCAEIVGGETPVVSDELAFISLSSKTEVFTSKTKPSSGTVKIPAGTVVIQAASGSYVVDGVSYVQLYYKNKLYNCCYADISSDIMSEDEANTYIRSLYDLSLSSTLKYSLGLKGNVEVYALQYALKTLGYFTGTVNGTFGTNTTTAIKNFQRAKGLSVDGACGTKTWNAVCDAMNSTVIDDDFGVINSITKAEWNYDDNGASLLPKGSYAKVMDVETGKVFTIYRWSGGSHADCVPATSADTEIMCDIVGFTYNPSHPTAAQLAKIKADGDADVVNYTWPDFKAKFGGTATNIGSKWDRRAALLNVDGQVYCISIYGFPHGFNGTSSFSKSKFPSGVLFYEQNNYYGMMCLHFVNSKTHSGNLDAQHQANIVKAYQYAQTRWPELCD